MDGSKLLSGVRAGAVGGGSVILCIPACTEAVCTCVCRTPVSEVSIFGVDIWLLVQKFVRPSLLKLLLVQETEVLKSRC